MLMNIDITVQEFEKFIEFVETEKPKLSAKRGVVFGKTFLHRMAA